MSPSKLILPHIPLFINTFDGYYSTTTVAQAIGQGNFTTPVSRAWPTINLAYYFPIDIPWDYPVSRLYCENGSTASGNLDIGIYSIGGTKLVSTGSTAQAGTSVAQYISKSIILPKGSYYLALAMDGVVGTTIAQGFANIVEARLAGLLQQGTAFPLPSSMTPATVVAFTSTLMYWPSFGFTSTSSGF